MNKVLESLTQEIDKLSVELRKLQRARELLLDFRFDRRHRSSSGRRIMSPEAREKISQSMKLAWATTRRRRK